MSTLQKILYACNKMQDDPSCIEPSTGICGNLVILCGVDSETRPGTSQLLRVIFASLGLDPDYPVPSPEWEDTEEGRELAFDDTDDMWEGGYGENRKYLITIIKLVAAGRLPTEITIDWPYPGYPGEHNEND